ncbi:hypothetical protein PtA15_3A232 [Puccinia triticina]|uniref:Uncharacterized protein n=1 Tax=Puccinia triticina TaxID=208348 RepID=A0ABY7CEG0_9BASI|nr:uncharacterized protein PtA15_3A232 [Puccinia triticina]WAQ82867.1 hypothetical protein PtA15_3A232 [Puccinia triticina]
MGNRGGWPNGRHRPLAIRRQAGRPSTGPRALDLVSVANAHERTTQQPISLAARGLDPPGRFDSSS